jgi:ABC-2 type transport system permease protein
VWILGVAAALPLGVGDVLLPAVFARDGEVYTVSPYLLLIGDYGLSFVRLVVVSTMAITLSALTRSASSAIALTVIFDLSGTMIAYLFYGFGIDWGRYLLFSNLDLAAILDGNAIFPHQSLAEAILCIVLHMAVFLLTAHDAFVRREV